MYLEILLSLKSNITKATSGNNWSPGIILILLPPRYNSCGVHYLRAIKYQLMTCTLTLAFIFVPGKTKGNSGMELSFKSKRSRLGQLSTTRSHTSYCTYNNSLHCGVVDIML